MRVDDGSNGFRVYLYRRGDARWIVVWEPSTRTQRSFETVDAALAAAKGEPPPPKPRKQRELASST